MTNATHSTPIAQRANLISSLNLNLADALDLHGHFKVAHWNVKGPHFAALHALFDSMAHTLADHSDDIAERVVTLGGQAHGLATHVAQHSRLAPYPPELWRDLEHVRVLTRSVEAFIGGLQSTFAQGEEANDPITVDLLTQIIGAWQKNAWMLRSTLAPESI